MSSKQKNMANAIRALAMDAVQQANSGHPGMPMGMAEIAESLGSAMTADFIAGIINTEELKNLKQIMFKLVKNRYAGIADNNKFIVGVDYSKMKLNSLENSFAVPSKQKKHSKIETAADTFELDMSPVIKPIRASFDDFNF